MNVTILITHMRNFIMGATPSSFNTVWGANNKGADMYSLTSLFVVRIQQNQIFLRQGSVNLHCHFKPTTLQIFISSLLKKQTDVDPYCFPNMIHNWAATRENLSSRVCEQYRRRPACASAQSDQRLCNSLFAKYHMLICYK